MNIQVIGISDVVGGGGLTLSFSAWNSPLKVINENKNKHSIRPKPPFSLSSFSTSSLQLSYLPVKPDETTTASECQRIPCSALNQENAVGIIGGVSVLSTLIFLEKLIWWSSRSNGGEAVPFIICSDPMLRLEAYAQSENIVENLERKRVFLEEGGARCIVMPCHLSHTWYGEISKGCKLPFLHVAECVARELEEAKFKPLEAGSRVKIGVIATDDTLMAGFYQEKLQHQGFEVVLPDEATMDHIIYPAIKSLNQTDKEGARNLLRIAIQLLLVRAANTVIIASDELQGLLPHDDPLSKKCVDPLDSLARAAVTWAKSVQEKSE